MKALAIISIVLGTLLQSCSSNTQDDLIPVGLEQDEQEEVELVTFTDVSFVFENICTQCHTSPPQNGAPMSLASYLAVKNAVLNRGLLDRISRQEGESGLMPLGGPRLPQQTIDLIVQWSEDGLLED